MSQVNRAHESKGRFGKDRAYIKLTMTVLNILRNKRNLVDGYESFINVYLKKNTFYQTVQLQECATWELLYIPEKNAEQNMKEFFQNTSEMILV